MTKNIIKFPKNKPSKWQRLNWSNSMRFESLPDSEEVSLWKKIKKGDNLNFLKFCGFMLFVVVFVVTAVGISLTVSKSVISLMFP